MRDSVRDRVGGRVTASLAAGGASLAAGRVSLVAAGSIALGAAVAGPAPASAQSDGPSILQLLPLTGTVEIGTETTGSLTFSDYLSGGRRVKAYGFTGAQGAPVTIDVISDDFDAYAFLIGPDGTELESDDDSGGACHARISTFLPRAGEYRIVAATFGSGTGSFTLRVDAQQHPPAAGDCGGALDGGMLEMLAATEVAGSLGAGEEVTGELGPDDARMSTDGSPIEAYHVVGTPGQTVVIDLMSRAFDTLLFVVEPDGSDYIQDDDSGGACNSRLTITLDMQPHLIVVNSIYSESSGPFTLRVSEVEGPMAMGDCPGPAAGAARAR